MSSVIRGRGRRDPSRQLAEFVKTQISGYCRRPTLARQPATVGALEVQRVAFTCLTADEVAPYAGAAWLGFRADQWTAAPSALVVLVELFSQRLRTQDELADDLAGSLLECLEPLGAGVLIDAKHGVVRRRSLRLFGSLEADDRSTFLELCA